MHKVFTATGLLSGGIVALGSVIGFWNRSDEFSDSHNLTAHCTTVTTENRWLKNVPTKSPSIDKTNRAIAESRQLIKRLMLEQGVPGGQVAVTQNGRLVWSEGFGLADVENDIPCTPQSVMRIASISKPLSAVGLFQLWEKGLVDLDAPIQKYVPSFPEKIFDGDKVVITTKQFLCHMSGIRHYKKKGSEAETKELYCKKHYNTLEQSLELFAQDELLSKPGEEYHYSSHAWTLVGAVMEKVSSERYLQYMSRHVFTPLGMEATGGEFNDTLLYNRARHYMRSSKGKLQNTPYVDLSYKWPGGGLVSTASDLVKFRNAVLASYNKIESSTVPNKNLEKSSTIQNKVTSNADNITVDTSSPVSAPPNKNVKENKKTSNNEITSNVAQNSNTIASIPILAPPTTKLMLTAATSVVEPSMYPGLRFSLGWMVDTGEQGPTCGEDRPAFFGHTGGAVGCSSVLLVFPDTSEYSEGCEAREVCEARGVVVCVLLNLQDVKGVIKLGTDIGRQFL